MSTQDIFGIVAILYCIANLGSMGLELNLPETIRALRSPKLVTMTLVWSWILGPTIAILITKILPMSEAHAAGLLLFSLAPTAPMLPILIRKAKADMDISAAMMPLAVVGTVILMPLMAPVLIPGVSVSSLALAKQLVLTVLLPLVAGIVLTVYAKNVAEKIFPFIKKLAGLTTLTLLAFTVFMYWRELIDALGSYAVAAQVIFILVTAFGAYFLGFGLNQAKRSALALGICSRNGGAMFVAFAAFPVQDPNILVMILLAVPVPIIVWLVLARFFASRADKLVSV